MVAPCDHFGFFEMGSSSITVAGGEGWVCDTEGTLARFGRVMPRSARETDFFLVLTGMVEGGGDDDDGGDAKMASSFRDDDDDGNLFVCRWLGARKQLVEMQYKH